MTKFADELHATAYPLDATRFEEVEACVEKTIQLHGRLDGVANCVGSLLLKPAHATVEAEWLATVAANLTTAFAIVRAGAKAMMHDGGSIVLLSSAAARTGLVRTSLTARLTANEASLKAATAMHPLGRIGEPEDVASAIEWLLSPEQGWVTGQVLGVDGGLGSIRSR